MIDVNQRVVHRIANHVHQQLSLQARYANISPAGDQLAAEHWILKERLASVQLS